MPKAAPELSVVIPVYNEERYLAALAAWSVPIRERWLSMGDFGGGRNSRPALPPARNALILQSAWLGDSLLTFPLARDIKAALPPSARPRG